MYLYCICYIALVILAGLTVFRHRWNGTQILFSPFNVDRTLSLRGILVLLIVLHHLSGVTSFPGLSPSFRMLVSQFTFFRRRGRIHVLFHKRIWFDGFFT